MLNRPVYLMIAVTALYSPQSLHADEVVILEGSFGSFIGLGATAEEVQALGPDRVEPEAADEYRVASAWHYFSSRGIRVRVCSDDQIVGAINATVMPATRKFVTEAGVRIGANLDQTAAAYGELLQIMPETDGAIWFVDDQTSGNRLTFGFRPDGTMAWIALGALRENGWTCGAKTNK